MKVLITGFDPFGGDRINPAYEAVKLLPDVIDGHEIIKLEVPTVFNTSIEEVVKKIDQCQPDVCLNIGQAGGRVDVTVERVAININDGRIPDNEGNQPIDEPIDEDGEPAYFATIPIKAVVDGIRAEGIPASVSNSAGTYVCNHLMYGVLNHVCKNGLNTRAGFIHIPFLPEQVTAKIPAAPSMALLTVVKALETAIKVICSTDEDIKTVEGSTH